ncbi:MAG: hypothetical protein IK137_00705 [Bacilli bacterium]|nr:hypothetical protein [Bacilli bacterium]
MTQKELLYVEDAISHEDIIISNIKDYINCLEESEIVDFYQKELKTHEKIKKDLFNLLEDESND